MARRNSRLTLVEPSQPAPAFTMGLLEDALGLRLRFAQNHVFRHIGQAFAPFDITPLLFSMLVLIDANPGCRQSDLGGALGVKQPNLVERVDVLVVRGLVTRIQDRADRRANLLTLTEDGRGLLADLRQADQALNDVFVERLGPKDHAVLIDLLKRLAQGDADGS